MGLLVPRARESRVPLADFCVLWCQCGAHSIREGLSEAMGWAGRVGAVWPQSGSPWWVSDCRGTEEDRS